MKNFFLIILLAIYFPAKSQLLPVLTFSENDGLIGNSIRDLLIDKDGLLWIATDNGISIYDGTNFKNLDQTKGLLSKSIGALALNNDNSIYAGCSKGGLICIKNDSIIKCVTDQESDNYIYRKLYYSKYYNKLFVGTENGIFILHKNRLLPVLYNKDPNDRSIILSITGKDSLIFFTVLKGTSQGAYQLFYNSKNPEKSTGKRINKEGRFYCEIMDHYIFFAEHNKLLRYDLLQPLTTHKIIEFEKDFFIWQIVKKNETELLVGGLGDGRFKGGLYNFNNKSNEITKEKIIQNNQSITVLLYDYEKKIVWVGKDNDLIVYKNSQFEYLLIDFKEIIVDISFLKDTLYVLTESGVYCYYDGALISEVKKEKISRKIQLEFEKRLKRQGKPFMHLFDISFGYELTGMTKTNDQIFIQTGRGAVSFPDLKTYLPFGFGNFIIHNSTAYSSVLYKSLVFYKSFLEPIQYQTITDKSKNFHDVFEIILIKDVYYFASNSQGLSFICDDQQFSLNSSNSIVDNELIDMDESTDKKIWCISNEHLYKVTFNKTPIVESVIDVKKLRLKGNSVKWIKALDQFLFIATNEGIHKFDTVALFSNLGERYFYNQWNGFPFIAAYHPKVDNYGNLVVHTNHEIVWIKNVNSHNNKVKIDIYDVIIDNEKSLFSDFADKYISFNTKHISFKFRVIQLPSANNFIYKYKINNEDWVVGNSVDLLALRAGTYKIILETYNVENNTTIQKQFSFTINAPYWQRIWFWFLVFLLMGSLFLIIFKWRFRVLKKQTEEKSFLKIQNSELQLRSLQVQMNPHFIFNALNSIQYLVLSKNIKETLNYLGKLSGIIRTNLEFASEKYIPVNEEIEFLNNYLQIESLRFKNKFQFNFILEDIDQNLFMPPMIVQPIIENSIKHGINNCDYTGKIQVHFQQTESIFMITITDNGIGRKAAQHIESGIKKKNLGLSVIEKRLNLLNDLHKTNQYAIQIIDIQDNGNNTGTQVVLTLPVKSKNEFRGN